MTMSPYIYNANTKYTENNYFTTFIISEKAKKVPV